MGQPRQNRVVCASRWNAQLFSTLGWSSIAQTKHFSTNASALPISLTVQFGNYSFNSVKTLSWQLTRLSEPEAESIVNESCMSNSPLNAWYWSVQYASSTRSGMVTREDIVPAFLPPSYQWCPAKGNKPHWASTLQVDRPSLPASSPVEPTTPTNRTPKQTPTWKSGFNLFHHHRPPLHLTWLMIVLWLGWHLLTPAGRTPSTANLCWTLQWKLVSTFAIKLYWFKV